MSDTVRSVVFAVILCIACSMLLTTAASGLKEVQKRNILIDRRKNILKSVGLIDPEKKYAAAEIDNMFSTYIEKVVVDSDGRVIPEETPSDDALPIYLYAKGGGDVEAYIIPINTRGLWGKILGYLAMKSDGKTVAGFTVYSHSETPGLGGEIEQAWFQSNFVGKKILNPKGGFVSVSIAKGKAAESVPAKDRPNYVDGISGATLTGKFLSEGLHKILANYEPVSISFRNRLRYCKTNPNTPWCKK